jgi:hypothetical protein
MADEQIIYLSPEEELTNVRERLEHITARRIILVVPAQTQLRSHVSWRLLHVRARELKKDILIISADRQIRSVVKAAGFKVADSLESTPTSKPRPASRPGRPALGGRTSARLRTPISKVSPERQSSKPRVQPPPDLMSEPELDEKISHTDEDNTLSQTPTQSSATFDTNPRPFGQDYNYRPGSPSAPLQPLNEPYEDEEPNHVYEDYRQSQIIRQAAQQKGTETPLPPEQSSETEPPIYDTSLGQQETDDPFTYLADDQTARLPEQHGAVFMDDRVPDIASYPTDLLPIEDEGDMGDFVDRSTSASARAIPTSNEEQDIPGPPRVHGSRPRTNRGGKFMPPPSTPAVDEDDMDLPPVYEQSPSTAFPAAAARQGGGQPSGGLGRAPEAVELPQPRSQTKAGRRPLKKRPAPSRARAPRQVNKPQVTAKSPGRVGGVGRLIVPVLVALIVLLIIALVYLVPTADVIVTLPSQSYNLPLKLTATTTSHQDSIQHTLPAHTLVMDTSVQGTGKPTGVITVGTVPADGTVYFTNNGNVQVDIPTGTTIATKNNILFTTQADVLLQKGQTAPTTILAQNPGTSGNVPPDTITVIPAQSISKLQQANPGAAINLTVNNPDPTAHGGAGKASTVTNGDVNSVKNTLDIQVDALIKSYLQMNVRDGDKQGNVVRVETPVVNPSVGSVVSGGTFTETLKVHMTVLVVRAADLQAAAMAEMRNSLSQRSPSLALVPQQTVELKQLKNTPARDGSSLVLSFTVVGQVAPQITEDTVRNLMSGKSIDYAQGVLNGKNGTPNVVHTQVSVNPGFFQWMPFIPQHITVHFKTTPVPPPPKRGKS